MRGEPAARSPARMTLEPRRRTAAPFLRSRRATPPTGRPAKQAFTRRLEGKFRVSKWMKQTALNVGLSEGRIEQIKQTEPVRRALIWRNKLALARRALRGR